MDVRIIEVQHHWAHIASVLAEHGHDGPVIGIACDGTGYGIDGAIWGCECLIASLEKFRRFGHLSYYQLPGADKASKEAIRPILGLLKSAYGSDFKPSKLQWLLEHIGTNSNNKLKIETCLTTVKNRKSKIILEQLEKRINTVETSSLGRVFDAVAAMLGLGSYNHFEAQLPMALEAIIKDGIEDCYDFELIREADKLLQLGLRKMIKGIINDIQKELPAGFISAKFHNTLAIALLAMAKQARESTKLGTVAISGGVFCNRYLTNRLIKLLKKEGFDVLFNRDVPANDGGISLGQVAIAAHLVNRES